MLASGPLAAETLFDLSDLSDQQREVLFNGVDGYAVVEAFLNYCQRPPELESKVRKIAKGCISEKSLSSVAERYAHQITIETGNPPYKYNCADPGVRYMANKFEKKIELFLANLKYACRFRALYSLPWPKILN